MDVSWLDEQIERLMHGTRCAQTVRDLAAFLIVRDAITKGAGDSPAPYSDETPSLSMLNQTPTLDQIQRALGAIVVNTPEERQQAQDLQTWIQIIGGER